ncbi:MAG: MarR family transcriptional regulator [Brumimicrobium sp.]
MTLSEKQLKLIEKTGVFLTEIGMKPATARINALLLISDKVELTFDEIREVLNLSKSATSNGINFLLATKRAEYVTKTGDRKRYFRSNIETWKRAFDEHFRFINEFRQLMIEISEIRTPKTTEFNKSLDEVISFMEFTMDELTGLYEKWQKQHQK